MKRFVWTGVLTGAAGESFRRGIGAALAFAALLAPLSGHAGDAADFASSAYIRFTEVSEGTRVQDQYQSLGFHFSGGTVEAHGASRWLAQPSGSLTISLRDPHSSAPLSVSALSFDIDSAKGGGQFQVQAFDRSGAAIWNSIVIGGTRAVLHAAGISSLKISVIGATRNWGIGQLRAGADAAPESAGAVFKLCYTYYYGGYPYSMTVVDPPGPPISIVADDSGCGSLPLSSGNASIYIEAYYVPPSSKCATYNGQPVDFALAGYYIPFLYGPASSKAVGPFSELRIKESAGDGDAGCSSLDVGNSTVGYVTFEAGVVALP